MITKTVKYTKKSTLYLKSEFRKHASTAIIAAFSFLIALVWKDLIVKLVQNNTKLTLLDKYPYLPELITAITVTLIAILGITLISLWATKPNQEVTNKKDVKKK
jgi:MFS superfamily sulfate permease-like transporter